MKLSTYREYRPIKWDRNRYLALFSLFNGDRNRYRIYLPLVKQKSLSKRVPSSITQELDRLGYTISDYRLGLAQPRSGKNPISLGKLLNNKPDLLKEFVNDPNRQGGKTQNSDYIVVVSRHPYDLISMSTGRGWTSCLDLESGYQNSYQNFLKTEAQEGTLVAYLVKRDKETGTFDLNINRPVARIKIYCYKDQDQDQDRGSYYLTPAKPYGDASGSFLATVNRFCNYVNKRQMLNAVLSINPCLVYRDQNPNITSVKTKMVVLTDFKSVFAPNSKLTARIKTCDPVTVLKISSALRKKVLTHALNYTKQINMTVLFIISHTTDRQFLDLSKLVQVLSNDQLVQLSKFGSSSTALLKEFDSRNLPEVNVMRVVEKMSTTIKDPELIQSLFSRLVTEKDAHDFLFVVKRPLALHLILTGLRSASLGQREAAVLELVQGSTPYDKQRMLLGNACAEAQLAIIRLIQPLFVNLDLMLASLNPTRLRDLKVITKVCNTYYKEKELINNLVNWLLVPGAKRATLVPLLFDLIHRQHKSSDAYDHKSRNAYDLVASSIESLTIKNRKRAKLYACLAYVRAVAFDQFIECEIASLTTSDSAGLVLARKLRSMLEHCSVSKSLNARQISNLTQLANNLCSTGGKARDYLIKYRVVEG